MKWKVTWRLECVQHVEAFDPQEACQAALKNGVAAFQEGGCTMQLNETIVEPAEDSDTPVVVKKK